MKSFLLSGGFLFALVLGACARTDIIESPRTAYVPANAETKEPAMIWTSRTLTQNFDYLGQIKVRSWTYDGAVERLLSAGREMHADAVIDVNFQQVGFLNTLQAFAIKFKDK